MGVDTALHDNSLPGQLSQLALFSLITEEPKPDLGDRKVVRGLEIFRAGTFKDSNGKQNTWSAEDLRAMANHFAALRATGKFPNVPVRADHSSSVASLIGYIEHLTVVGDRLVADVEFTEPDHFAKFDRGTYRSRSVEIGKYQDNDGNEYWPTVFGLAFVDLPAVEGLHRSNNSALGHFHFATGTSREDHVPEKNEPTFTFKIGGQDTTDFTKVQAHVSALEGENAALQTRNTALETFAQEQKVVGRHNFVTGLAEAKKIAATQIDALKVLVQSMTDEQYTAFQAAYEAAPAMSLLGEHGDGITNPAGEPSVEADERAVLEETVKMHRRSGVTEEELAKTPSFRKLAVLNGQK